MEHINTWSTSNGSRKNRLEDGGGEHSPLNWAGICGTVYWIQSPHCKVCRTFPIYGSVYIIFGEVSIICHPSPSGECVELCISLI
jgi:hypothetical protein